MLNPPTIKSTLNFVTADRIRNVMNIDFLNKTCREMQDSGVVWLASLAKNELMNTCLYLTLMSHINQRYEYFDEKYVSFWQL